MFLILLRPTDLRPDISQYSRANGARKFTSKVRQRTWIPDDRFDRFAQSVAREININYID